MSDEGPQRRTPSSPGTERVSLAPDGTVRGVLERPRTTPSIRPAASSLRQAIAAQRRLGPPGAIVGASVERVSIEVKIGGRTEIVAIGLDGSRLLVAASDGAGEGSPFAQAALAWLDAADGTTVDDGGAKLSIPAAAASDRNAAAADLVVAIARAGARAGRTPAVDEALGRIAAEPRGALPLVRSRWLARLGAALTGADADLVARLLEHGVPPALGAPDEVVVDRSYVEVGREPLVGDGGTTIERRYLLDVARGDLVVEERALGEAGGSLGPCPRLCAVGYGELFAGAPRRVVISQYAVVPEVANEHWERVLGCGVALASATASALEAITSRGEAEPVAIVLGATFEEGFVVDAAGTRYGFARAEPGATAAAALEAHQAKVIRWMLCRFEIAAGAVGVVPVACGWQEDDTWRHARLR